MLRFMWKGNANGTAFWRWQQKGDTQVGSICYPSSPNDPNEKPIGSVYESGWVVELEWDETHSARDILEDLWNAIETKRVDYTRPS